MNKKNKAIILTGTIFAILITSVILNLNFSYRLLESERMASPFTSVFPDYSEVRTIKLSLNKTVDVEKKIIFNTLTDVLNYPLMLPSRVSHVNILEQSNNTMLAEEFVTLSGLREKLIVKHTFTPYEKHIIEIMEGDASGTKIVQTFLETDSGTEIQNEIELKVKGVLTPLSFILQTSTLDYIDSTLDQFVDYSKGFENETEKIIDDLYRNILKRPADKEGLIHYGNLVQQGELSIDELKQILLQSDERKSLLDFDEWKTETELNETTKKIINDLYQEILSRPVDTRGLEYYGSLMEKERLTIDELRQILINSDEKKALLE